MFSKNGEEPKTGNSIAEAPAILFEALNDKASKTKRNDLKKYIKKNNV